MPMRHLPRFLLTTSVVLLAACGNQAAPVAHSPAAVDVVTATAVDLPIRHDLVGRLAPTRVAEVRARVAGIVLERAYKEGSDVRAGQLLFRIDPAPLQAAVNEKSAALAQAQATANNAATNAKRLRELAKRGVISAQDVDDASAKAASARAAVAQARAALESARLDLSYATVNAPIAGRAGRALVTQGALVGQGSATALTTVEQIDPIYVNFSQPMQLVQQLRAEQVAGKLATRSGDLTVSLKLPDGQRYAHAGTLDFADMAVDPATGAVSLRAEVPNPQHQLLPGMFVDVVLDSGTLKQVYLIPQQAVQRDGTGAYVWLVVDDKVERRGIETRSMQGGNWIVGHGLADGDKVIVNGIQSVHAGDRVAVHAWQPHAAATTATD